MQFCSRYWANRHQPQKSDNWYFENYARSIQNTLDDVCERLLKDIFYPKSKLALQMHCWVLLGQAF